MYLKVMPGVREEEASLESLTLLSLSPGFNDRISFNQESTPHIYQRYVIHYHALESDGFLAVDNHDLK